MRLIKILLTIIVVLVLALVTLIFVLPGEKVAKLAADQVKAQTGRDLTFDGEVNFSVYPTLGISTGAVTLSNAEWSDQGPMFQAEAAKIGVDLMALIGGAVEIKNITLTSPKILLQKDNEGHANWDLLPATEVSQDTTVEEAPTEAGPAFTLDHLKVTDAQVRYLDAAGQDIMVNDLTADLTWGNAEATIELSAKPFTETVELSATIADLNGLMAGEITKIDSEFSTAGNIITFNGRASITPEISGDATAKLPNPNAFFAAIGQPGTEMPATDFKGSVTLTKEQLFSLRGGEVSIADNDLRAEVDIQLAAKPVVTANIQADTLNFATLSGGESAETTTESKGWSTDPIDASALGLFDGTITISANAIDTGSLQFGLSRLKVDIDNSRAVATLQEINGYDGKITGQFVANNRNGLSVGGKMALAELSLKPLLTDMVEIDRFTGSANGTLAFLGSGNSLNKIINSLKGDGTLNVGQGTISGINLDKLFRGTPDGGTTVFDKMSASWTIADGVVNNSDLLMDLPSVQAKGAGTIGLGQQNIDYTFTPQIKNNTDTGIAVPVRIKGPWADPKIWPDLEAIVNQNLAEEKKQLEEKAKKAVADKLGVTTEEGQSIEKALEKKLEEKLNDKLKGLFGGSN